MTQQIIEHYENELMKIKMKIEEIELIEKYPTVLDAFVCILEIEQTNETDKIKKLMGIYNREITQKDIIMAKDIKKQIKDKFDNLYLFLLNDQINPLILTAIAIEQEMEEQFIKKVIDLYENKKMIKQRKDQLLYYFDSTLIEIVLFKREHQKNSQVIKMQYEKFNQLHSLTPNFESPSPSLEQQTMSFSSIAEMAKVVENNFKINSDLVMILMNTIQMNKFNIITENGNQIDRLQKKTFINRVKEQDNMMLFFYLKRYIVGLYFESCLFSGKQTTEQNKYLLFFIDENTISFCSKKINDNEIESNKTIQLRLGNEKEESGNWFEIENCFSIHQEKIGTMFSTSKLFVDFNEMFEEEFKIPKKVNLSFSSKYEIVRFGALKWYN